jgi:hypothetical protein
VVSSFPPHGTSWDATDAKKRRCEPDGVRGQDAPWGEKVIGHRRLSPPDSGVNTGLDRVRRSSIVLYLQYGPVPGWSRCLLSPLPATLWVPSGTREHEKTKAPKEDDDAAKSNSTLSLRPRFPHHPAWPSPCPSIFRQSPHHAEHGRNLVDRTTSFVLGPARRRGLWRKAYQMVERATPSHHARSSTLPRYRLFGSVRTSKVLRLLWESVRLPARWIICVPMLGRLKASTWMDGYRNRSGERDWQQRIGADMNRVRGIRLHDRPRRTCWKRNKGRKLIGCD